MAEKEWKLTANHLEIFIDAIEIKNLNIKIKNIKCYGNRF